MSGAGVISAFPTGMTPRRAARARIYDPPVVVDLLDAVDPTAGDAALISAMAAGDQQALSRLYERYGRMLHAIAVRITGDRQAAEECTQDAFMSAWRWASSFDPGRSRASTWLCAIARNRALDAARAQARRPVPHENVEPDGRAPDTADLVQDADAAVQVAEAMAKLPPAQYDVLQLAYFDGLSQSQIAERLDLPLGTVKSRMRLAMGRMRDVARDLGLEA